jgi:hypothetical protein
MIGITKVVSFLLTVLIVEPTYVITLGFNSFITGKVISRLFCKEKTGRTDTVLHQRPTGHPKEIVPSGLDEARRKYLFKEIREFCTPGTRDLVCPEPPEETQPATKKARPK